MIIILGKREGRLFKTAHPRIHVFIDWTHSCPYLQDTSELDDLDNSPASRRPTPRDGIPLILDAWSAARK